MNDALLQILALSGILLTLALAALVALVAATVGWRLAATVSDQLRADRRVATSARRKVGQVID